MLAGTYADKTLNDNWFEDRLQVKSPGRSLERHVRHVESDIATTRLSRSLQEPSFAIPDDGFARYQTSKTQEEYPHPRTRTEVVFNPPKKTEFLNTETIPEVCHADRRPMNDVPARGFRAVLTRHDDTEGERSWTTSTRDGVAIPPGQSQEQYDTRRTELKTKAAGVPGIRDFELRKEGGLVGENERLCNIPVQRAWMAQEDPGLREFHKNGGNPGSLPATDNELSLPIGDGAQKKVMEALKTRGGKLYRTKTSITQTKAKKGGFSVWDDYP